MAGKNDVWMNGIVVGILLASNNPRMADDIQIKCEGGDERAEQWVKANAQAIANVRDGSADAWATQLKGPKQKAAKAEKPRFGQGDKVRVAFMDGKIGTIVRTPKKRSTGLLYGGEYAYDVEFTDHATTRLSESHLSPVTADAAKAGK